MPRGRRCEEVRVEIECLPGVPRDPLPPSQDVRLGPPSLYLDSQRMVHTPLGPKQRRILWFRTKVPDGMAERGLEYDPSKRGFWRPARAPFRP